LLIRPLDNLSTSGITDRSPSPLKYLQTTKSEPPLENQNGTIEAIISFDCTNDQ